MDLSAQVAQLQQRNAELELENAALRARSPETQAYIQVHSRKAVLRVAADWGSIQEWQQCRSQLLRELLQNCLIPALTDGDLLLVRFQGFTRIPTEGYPAQLEARMMYCPAPRRAPDPASW